MERLHKNIPDRVFVGYGHPEVGIDQWLRNRKKGSMARIRGERHGVGIRNQNIGTGRARQGLEVGQDATGCL